MTTITTPKNILKKTWTRIVYTKKLVFPKKKVTLLEYINSDEYKNENSLCFTPEEFLADLQKYKN